MVWHCAELATSEACEFSAVTMSFNDFPARVEPLKANQYTTAGPKTCRKVLQQIRTYVGEISVKSCETSTYFATCVHHFLFRHYADACAIRNFDVMDTPS